MDNLCKLYYINKKGEKKEYLFNSAEYKRNYIIKHNLTESMTCNLCNCSFQKISEYHHKKTAKHIKLEEITNNILMSVPVEKQNDKEYIKKLIDIEIYKIKEIKQINKFRKKYNFEN